MFKITGSFKGEVDCKRFYMPGVVASDICPKCAKDIVLDHNQHYIEYPTIGTPCLLYFYCSGCDTDWTRKVLLNLQITAVE